MDQQPKRKLAAILSSDVVGYTRLMADDDQATLTTLTVYRDVMRRNITEHDGRVVDSPGDALLAEFHSPIEAVRAAVAIQETLRGRNEALPEHRRMRLRIGIDLGDVLERDGALYGDGVNIAARLETLADHGGLCISGAVYDQVKSRIDRPYEPLGAQSVKNVPEPVRAYRVVIEGAIPQVRTRPGRGRRIAVLGAAAALLIALGGIGLWQSGLLAPAGSMADPVLELPDRPSVAVLPFENRSGDPERLYFVDGVTEDIVAGMARFSALFVISFNSTRTYRGQDVSPQDVAAALGVRYVLNGSFRESGDRMRLNVQLTDAPTGEIVWTDSYDRAMTDIFAVEDEIARQIAGTLGAKLSGANRASAQRKAPEDLNAYDTVLRARQWWNTVTPQDHAESRALMEEAVERFPDYARAHAALGYLYLAEYSLGMNPRPDPLPRAKAALDRAYALDPLDENTQLYLAAYYYWSGQDTLFAEAADRTLELNPNSAAALAELGIYRSSLLGELEHGAELARRAMRLDPNHPPYYRYALFREAYFTGRYDEAVAELDKIGLDELYVHQVWRAISYGQLGQAAEAAAARDKVLAMQPDYTSVAFAERFRMHDSLLNRFFEGADKAGLPMGGVS